MPAIRPPSRNRFVRALRASARKLIWHGPLAPVAAAFDMVNPPQADFLSEPLNGQSGRRAIVEGLLELFSIASIIETGTFRGSSARYFGSLRKAKVISIEAIPRHHWYARIRLRRNNRVRLLLGDSVSVIKTLATNRVLTEAPTLFYLDAHWEEHLPLGDELRLIAANWKTWVAVIDDFQVPDDPQYEFDDYGNGNSLDVSYLERVGLDNLQLFWPRMRAVDETGLRRGCVVVTTNASVGESIRSQSRTLRED